MSEGIPDRFNLLYRLTQAISSSQNLDDVMENVMDQVVTATRAERGFIMIPGESNDAPHPVQLYYATRGLDINAIDAPAFHYSRSLLDQVFTTGQPVLTSDAQSDARFRGRESVVLYKLRSILCIPIKTQHATLGVIYVDNRIMTGVFTQAELELLTTIASHAAQTIENIRLIQETRHRLQSLKAIYEITADLTSTLDLDRVLTKCLDKVMTLISAQAASILMVEGEELVFQIALGEKAAEIKPFRIPPGQGIAGWVVEHGQPVMVNDVHSDPRFYSYTDSKTGFVTQSLLAAPLTINDRHIGVIEVFNKPSGFSVSDLELLCTVAASAAIAIENARLYKAAVEKGRMERELQVAREVQLSLLPTQFPQPPGWDFAAHWQPAREVGGDYYDFLPFSDQRIGMVIADVTDKGMPAALFMAFARSVVRASVYGTASPLEGLSHANRLICSDSSYGLFVTLFYGVLDLNANTISYVNCGHNPPLLFKPAAQQILQLTAAGLPLGIDADATYQQNIVSLEHGDILLMYTDGISEAIDVEEHQYGMDSIATVLNKNPQLNATQMIAALEDSVNSHCGLMPPSDDRTIVVLKRT